MPGQCDQDSEWQCVDQQSCIDKRRRCDGYGDCADLSDEDEQLCYNCKFSVMSIVIYAWPIQTRSISLYQLFLFSKVECLEWQFQCNDRKRCIDKRRMCDGYKDCSDNSDELECPEGKNKNLR